MQLMKWCHVELHWRVMFLPKDTSRLAGEHTRQTKPFGRTASNPWAHAYPEERKDGRAIAEADLTPRPPETTTTRRERCNHAESESFEFRTTSSVDLSFTS